MRGAKGAGTVMRNYNVVIKGVQVKKKKATAIFSRAAVASVAPGRGFRMANCFLSIISASA